MIIHRPFTMPHDQFALPGAKPPYIQPANHAITTNAAAAVAITTTTAMIPPHYQDMTISPTFPNDNITALANMAANTQHSQTQLTYHSQQPIPMSSAATTTATRKRRRPPYSYTALIAQAILASQHRRLTLREIYDWISTHYPLICKGPDVGWQNTIRHNLSLNQCFHRIPRAELPSDVSTKLRGKGSYWTVDEALMDDNTRKRVEEAMMNIPRPDAHAVMAGFVPVNHQDIATVSSSLSASSSGTIPAQSIPPPSHLAHMEPSLPAPPCETSHYALVTPITSTTGACCSSTAPFVSVGGAYTPAFPPRDDVCSSAPDFQCTSSTSSSCSITIPAFLPPRQPVAATSALVLPRIRYATSIPLPDPTYRMRDARSLSESRLFSPKLALLVDAPQNSRSLDTSAIPRPIMTNASLPSFSLGSTPTYAIPHLLPPVVPSSSSPPRPITSPSPQTGPLVATACDHTQKANSRAMAHITPSHLPKISTDCELLPKKRRCIRSCGISANIASPPAEQCHTSHPPDLHVLPRQLSPLPQAVSESLPSLVKSHLRPSIPQPSSTTPHQLGLPRQFIDLQVACYSPETVSASSPASSKPSIQNLLN